MAKRKKAQPQRDSFRKFMDGEPVIVGRAIIWGGWSGTVVGFRGGLHVVSLDTKPDGKKCSPFPAELLGEELETHL